MARSKGKKRRILNKRKKACLGKIKHKYLTSAQYVFDRMDEKNLSIYKCEFCGFYHIGKDPYFYDNLKNNDENNDD